MVFLWNTGMVFNVKTTVTLHYCLNHHVFKSTPGGIFVLSSSDRCFARACLVRSRRLVQSDSLSLAQMLHWVCLEVYRVSTIPWLYHAAVISVQFYGQNGPHCWTHIRPWVSQVKLGIWKKTHANTEILTVTWNQPILVKIPCSRILYVSPTKQARLRIFKSAAGNMDDIKSI